MSNKRLGKYEKEIKEAINKKESELTGKDKFVLKIISKAKEYFYIYDLTENKNTLLFFKALFLETKNRSKTEISFGNEFGLCSRSVIRHKKKVLTIYMCIYEHNKK